MGFTKVPGAGDITPAPQKQSTASNYIDFTSANTKGWAQQYLPDLMEKEAEVFGPRTISGFLSQVGAEESMAADQVIWTEQGRLHLSYKGCTIDVGNAGTLNAITIANDIDGNPIGATHGIRVGDMVLVSASTGVSAVGHVTNIAASPSAVITVEPYSTGSTMEAAVGATVANAADITVLVIGSEFVKGDTGRTSANEPAFAQFNNKPIIMKDFYQISGSDTSQIGWVEVSGEEGQNGYLWYLKAAGDTRARFSDYVEMAMLEAKKNVQAFSANALNTAAAGDAGTQGLFDALEDRGNVSNAFLGTPPQNLLDFDLTLAQLDTQGAIEENMMFLNRATSLKIDDMLASMNSYGVGGTSFGVFNNSEDMALNLGFSGFRRGSYDFYKSDFRYLNDAATRGAINAGNATEAIRGVFIPAGVTSVYDQSLGRNLKRPFLHVRYRASEMESRQMKTWTTGSVGATTSSLDAMEMHFLTERCLVTQGANNFILLKG
jgi:hypothetical protein